jgi:hypothetical protein
MGSYLTIRGQPCPVSHLLYTLLTNYRPLLESFVETLLAPQRTEANPFALFFH